MLVKYNTFWMVEPHSDDAPVAFLTLLDTLRTARHDLGLPEAKQLGTKYTFCIIRSNKDFERHARVVGGTLLYIIDGYPTKDPYYVIRKIRDKINEYHLHTGEVSSASRLPTPRTAAYLSGRMPKSVNLFTLAQLAETIDMSIEYHVVWDANDIRGFYKASQAGEDAQLDAALEDALRG